MLCYVLIKVTIYNDCYFPMHSKMRKILKNAVITLLFFILYPLIILIIIYIIPFSRSFYNVCIHKSQSK